MTQVTDGIYADGVLKPIQTLTLSDQERVRIIVQSLECPSREQREAAFAELVQGIEQMNFRSTRPYPTRDELHERR